MEKTSCDAVLMNKIAELSSKVSNLEKLVHDLDSLTKVFDSRLQRDQTDFTTHISEFMEYKEVITKFKENIIEFKALCAQIVDSNKQANEMYSEMHTSLTSLKQDFRVESVRFEQFQNELLKLSKLIEEHDDEFDKLIETQTINNNTSNTMTAKIVDIIRRLQTESSTLHEQCAMLADDMAKVKSNLQDMSTTASTLKKVFSAIGTILALLIAFAGLDFITSIFKQ